ncbi:CYTH and CHAD domain-containing protein [Kitasatospora purpeofusca]|uniref:CYTH and CHAD domain-containing protein n=1 Tax=Kitasatospora purpeofusca TaxID=67352 RepID=UPI002A5A8EC7|nr:CYTH and CHAD domain-containing protein [Kitasatospora purpeofusca]MDY0811357.1 CYTH and CHAD domain-containing protein [Kitasatospora purpeofusca]
MSAKQLETERKFDGTAALPPLELPGVAKVVPAGPQDLDAVYYDTPDLDLLSRQVTLRRRTGGGDAGWHLKLPTGTDSREEIHAPLEAGAPDRPPAALAARVAVFLRGEALVPVARLRTHRRRRHLLDRRGKALAELAEDRVEARILGPVPVRAPEHPAPDGDRTGSISWTEVEVELAGGDAELLDRVEQALTAAGLERADHPSKLARALRDAPRPDRRRAPLRTGTPGGLVTGRIRELVDDLLALDPSVRLDEPDSVHRMRVTARRLRSTLKAHRRLFDRRRTDALAAEIRWLGRSLGNARDQEVLGEHLVTALDALDSLPDRLRGGPARGEVSAHYARAYRQAWEQVVRDLGSVRYHRLLNELESFAADPPLTARADRKKPRKRLSRTLRHEQRRTLDRLDAALGLDSGPERDAALHSARKAAKRARYAAEAARPTAPERARKFEKRMKRLQRVLGGHQDTVVARQALLDHPGPGEDHAFTSGVLYAAQQRDAEQAERRLPALRRRVSGPRLARLT